jgi:putative ABC transport system permease protein
LDVTTLIQDLRFGVRMMAKTPVVSAVAILSLALGIAANASMFALANAFLFEPFPYADQERLVLFRSLRAGEPLELAGGVSVPNFREYVAASDAIEGAALYTTEFLNLTGLDVPEQLSVVAATPTLFDVLGVEPLLGRGFRPAEGVEGNGRVVVLHHDYWQARFLGDREVLGRSVTLGGEPHTIVGVMPPDFDLIPANIQALRPTDFEQERDNRANRGYTALARLGTGATVEQLQREIDPVAERQATEFPEANRGMQVMAQPLRSFFPGPTDTRLVQLLTAVTLFGLLIACVNVANLLLSRAEQRQTEVAVRTALGAPRGRILAQLLTESVAMGVVAGAIGLALAVWIVAWLRSALPAELPTAVFPELDPEVLLATLAISVLAGAVFGLAPALHSAGGNLRDSLGSGRGSTAGRRRRRLRNVFVIGEVAVALALLTGAGFMIQAFDQLVRADPGFDPGGLLTFRVTVLEDRYPEDADVAAYQRELVRALEAIPAVEGVALMSSLPRGFENPQRRYTVDGRPLPEPSELRTAGLQAVNPDYFATMRVPLVQGRLLDESDREDAERVALISRGLAAREFPNEDPLARSLTVAGESRRIVGVVENILQERMELAGRSGEQVYLPFAQLPLRDASFALRTSGDPAALASDVRAAIWSVQPDQPVAQVRTFEAHAAEALAGPRALSAFLVAIGGIALALAAMGIYGVMAHSVAQQQREISIRLALGAGRARVLAMVARSGLALVGVGLVLGLPLAFAMFRGTAAMMGLFSAEPGFVYPVGLGAALLAVAVVAILLPARRASAVAPATALKE